MRVNVDMGKCQAYGICASTAPGLFDLDDWGYAQLIGDGTVEATNQPAAREAANGCPAEAISLDAFDDTNS